MPVFLNFRNALINVDHIVSIAEDGLRKAASERHADGNIRKSIEHNAVRFNMSPDLVRIFENTIEILNR